MNKKYFFVLGIGVLLLVGAGIWYGVVNRQDSDPGSETVSFDLSQLQDPDWVFSIPIPEEFDAFKRSRAEEKIAGAKKLYEEKPDDNWTWIVLGDMYEFVHDYDRALLVYHKAIQLDAGEFVAPFNIGIIYEKQKKEYALAEKYYEQSIATRPPGFTPYAQLAEMYWHRLNRPEDAERIYLQALDESTRRLEPLLSLVSFYEKTNNIPEAKEFAKKLKTEFPSEFPTGYEKFLE